MFRNNCSTFRNVGLVISKQKGTYPVRWEEGLRIAILMVGDNIRPITIEPIFENIFEIVMDKRLSFVNNAFEGWDVYNSGVVKWSMTQDNILIFLSCIQKQIPYGKALYILHFFYFKRVFNCVTRTLLVLKII